MAESNGKYAVALRKESVDRNRWGRWREQLPGSSLSARRAWIEISMSFNAVKSWVVALRKESVDRNYSIKISTAEPKPSLSVRRAWIEMLESKQIDPSVMSLSVRRAWIEIVTTVVGVLATLGRSP